MIKILFVDDEIERVYWFKELFGDIPFNFLHCDNPMDAIRKIRTETFDLIFLDHDLGDGEISGVDVASCMYGSKNRFSKVIIHSANIVGAYNIFKTLESMGIKSDLISVTDEDYKELTRKAIIEGRLFTG